MIEQIKKIREERRRYEITQTELAVAIGQKANNVYISKLEKGLIPASPEQIGKIFAAIEVIKQRKESVLSEKDNKEPINKE